jgi:hypothetical protein
MKLSFVLTLFAASLSVTAAQAQVPRAVHDVINDLSPDRKASAEGHQPPRSPKQPAAGAATKNKPGIPGDSDRPEEPILREMPKDLSAAVSRALLRNPQVLIADAKVRQAQAELNEAKFKVVSKVTAAFRDYAHYKKMLVDVQNPNSASDDLRRQIRQEIEASELDLIYLLGIGAEPTSLSQQAKLSVDETDYVWTYYAKTRGQPGTPAADDGAPKPIKNEREARSPAIPKALRAVLAEETVLDFADQPLRDAVEYLSDRHGFQFITHEKSIDVPVSVNISGITLAAALQAIADLTNYCFVFRDYGILVVKEAEAELYEQNGAAMIAPGRLPPVIEDRDSDAAGGEKQPAEAVQRQ